MESEPLGNSYYAQYRGRAIQSYLDYQRYRDEFKEFCELVIQKYKLLCEVKTGDAVVIVGPLYQGELFKSHWENIELGKQGVVKDFFSVGIFGGTSLSNGFRLPCVKLISDVEEDYVPLHFVIPMGVKNKSKRLARRIKLL